MVAKRVTKPSHKPTADTRKQTEAMAGYGVNHECIASVIGIDSKTLRKHYRTELDVGKAKANVRVAGALFNKAVGGDTTAMIFWTKTQLGWKEVQGVEHSGVNGGDIKSTVNFGKASAEQLRAIAALAIDSE